MPLRKVLIVNRGEVAVRIARACRELGLGTVAVYSSADDSAHHARYADDAVWIGKPSARDSYLNPAAIIDAAQQTSADAVHPGYGFLADNADFAEMCEAAGLAWVGPSPEAIARAGDKASRGSSHAKQEFSSFLARSARSASTRDSPSRRRSAFRRWSRPRRAAGGRVSALRATPTSCARSSPPPPAKREPRLAMQGSTSKSSSSDRVMSKSKCWATRRGG